MKQNPLTNLEALGQSIWLDYIRRDLITSKDLEKLIKDDGLGGITSNPSIFEKAIAESDDYDQAIQKMKLEKKEIAAIYDWLTQRDVRDAADEFRQLYDNLEAKDGYVSLEVNPHLANDTKTTVQEARRLWKALDRPNVMIKVPATAEGLPAITELISEGININVTLLFGLPRYREVAEAYIAGLEARLARSQPIHHIASVASFFLSRIDVLIDPLLEKIMAENNDKSVIAKKIHGETAIASAKLAYQIYHEIFNSPRFKKLMDNGAEVQRLLWASTSTKNPAYSDVKYVEALIGPKTVNTLPMETLIAYRDHGNPQELLEQDLDKAKWIFQTLPDLNLDINKITKLLLLEGIDKFKKSYDQLLEALRGKLS